MTVEPTWVPRYRPHDTVGGEAAIDSSIQQWWQLTAMVSPAPLSTIIALARAGALDHAWYQFSMAGYATRDDDPAALTVKGRLLKDRALRASGEERRRFYLES